MTRRCEFRLASGDHCRAAPLRGGTHCFLHDPERAPEAAEARRLGGLRRRREGTLTAAYELEGLDSVAGLRRLLEIIVTDALSLDPGLGRLRVLMAGVNAGAKLLETGDLEARLVRLETLERRR